MQETDYLDDPTSELTDVVTGVIEYDPSTMAEGLDPSLVEVPLAPPPEEGYYPLFITLANERGGVSPVRESRKPGKVASVIASLNPRIVLPDGTLGDRLKTDHSNSTLFNQGGVKTSRLHMLFALLGRPLDAKLDNQGIIEAIFLAFAEQESQGFAIGGVVVPQITIRRRSPAGETVFDEYKGKTDITLLAMQQEKRRAKAEGIPYAFDPARWYAVHTNEGYVGAKGMVVKYTELRRSETDDIPRLRTAILD